MLLKGAFHTYGPVSYVFFFFFFNITVNERALGIRNPFITRLLSYCTIHKILRAKPVTAVVHFYAVASFYLPTLLPRPRL